jgi:hypothetical protein
MEIRRIAVMTEVGHPRSLVASSMLVELLIVTVPMPPMIPAALGRWLTDAGCNTEGDGYR